MLKKTGFIFLSALCANSAFAQERMTHFSDFNGQTGPKKEISVVVSKFVVDKSGKEIKIKNGKGNDDQIECMFNSSLSLIKQLYSGDGKLLRDQGIEKVFINLMDYSEKPESGNPSSLVRSGDKKALVMRVPYRSPKSLEGMDQDAPAEVCVDLPRDAVSRLVASIRSPNGKGSIATSGDVTFPKNGLVDIWHNGDGLRKLGEGFYHDPTEQDRRAAEAAQSARLESGKAALSVVGTNAALPAVPAPDTTHAK